MIPSECDYRRFGDVTRVWLSPDEFSVGEWATGVHVIHLAAGGHLDLFIFGDPFADTGQALPVFFSGAVSTRAGEPGPFLSGLKIGKEVSESFISVADPTLNHDPYLRVGWYTGRHGESVQKSITAVMDAIGRRTGRELLCIGGSGGGFASLQYATDVTCPASAMVWNPQTDLLDYSPNLVVDWLTVALGVPRPAVMRMSRAQWVTRLRGGGIKHRLTLGRSTKNPRRLLYLQSADDSHLQEHCQPLLTRSGFAGDDDVFTDPRGRAVWVGPLGTGHAPPAPEIISCAVTLMMDPSRSGVDAVDHLREQLDSGAIRPTSSTTATPTVRPDLRVAGPGLLDVNADGYEATHFAFHLYHEGERTETTTWSRSPRHRFSVTKPGEYRVRIFVLKEDRSRSAHPSNTVWVAPNEQPSSATVWAAPKEQPSSALIDCPPQKSVVIRTFIYGSCVSRDTFEFLEPHGYALSTYVARQSLLSAYSRIDAQLPEVRTSSPFQLRMIEGDWTSSLPRSLARVRGRVDLILWDLCDERLGVRRLTTGHVVTRSVDTITSGLDAQLEAQGARLEPIGSEWHRRHFSTRLAHFRQRLVDYGMLDRTIVLAPAWASFKDDDTPTPPSFGLTAADANPVFDWYYQAVSKTVGVPVLRLEQDEVAAARVHRWGAAPFHYTTSVYERMVAQIRDFAESREPPQNDTDIGLGLPAPTPTTDRQ